MRFCSECGNRVPLKSKFCSSCGASLAEEPEQSVEGAPSAAVEVPQVAPVAPPSDASPPMDPPPAPPAPLAAPTTILPGAPSPDVVPAAVGRTRQPSESTITERVLGGDWRPPLLVVGPALLVLLGVAALSCLTQAFTGVPTLMPTVFDVAPRSVDGWFHALCREVAQAFGATLRARASDGSVKLHATPLFVSDPGGGVYMPGIGVSGLESDGANLFYAGGGASGKVRAVRRPKR